MIYIARLAGGGYHSTLKFKLKKGHNSKTTAFRVMPLVLQLHLVMMSKYSQFGVDTLNTFNTFRVMGYIKVFARWQRRRQQQWQRSSDQYSLIFFFETVKLKIISALLRGTCFSLCLFPITLIWSYCYFYRHKVLQDHTDNHSHSITIISSSSIIWI